MEISTYKKKIKSVKWLKFFAFFFKYGLLVLSFVLLFISLKNSIGNISEIINLLDDKHFNGEQLKSNYAYLLDKYGEWQIGNGGSGFSIEFVNIGKAMFSGVATICFISAVICFICSFVFGRWIFPLIAKQIKENAQDDVNIELLKMAEKNKEK